MEGFEFHKTINWFFWRYKRDIHYQAWKVKMKFPNIPLEKEDLVNTTLFEIPTFMEKYEPEKKVPLKEYLMLQSYYFMLNYARKFTNKNTQIMNHAIDFEKVENIKSVNSFEDQKETKYIIHLTDLSRFEQDVYKNFFEKNLSTKDAANLMNVDPKSISNAITRIRKKIKVDFEEEY